MWKTYKCIHDYDRCGYDYACGMDHQNINSIITNFCPHTFSPGFGGPGIDGSRQSDAAPNSSNRKTQDAIITRPSFMELGGLPIIFVEWRGSEPERDSAALCARDKYNPRRSDRERRLGRTAEVYLSASYWYSRLVFTYYLWSSWTPINPLVVLLSLYWLDARDRLSSSTAVLLHHPNILRRTILHCKGGDCCLTIPQVFQQFWRGFSSRRNQE